MGIKVIKVLILYYLSLKPTHGYEIQKFIQVNHMDCWTKIQSGSIYYALAKLEKEGLIMLAKEVNVSSKTRKIYSITDKGQNELRQLVKEELKSPICEVGSDKFILYPLLSASNKLEIEHVISAHIIELKRKRDDMQKWQSIKVNSSTLEVEKLSFEMMLSNLDYQIKWHQALLSQIDQCMEGSIEIAKYIQTYDFTNCEIVNNESVNDLESRKNHTLKI